MKENKKKKLQNIKRIIYNILPIFFIFLLLFFVWLFIKPYMLANKEMVEEIKKYEFFDNQDDLEPSSLDSLNLNELFRAKKSKNIGVVIKIKPTDDLSEIIKDAGYNQIIELGKGVYKVNVEINNKLSIIGQGVDTVIQAADENKPIFDIKETEFNISDLVIRESNIGIIMYKVKADIFNVKFVDFDGTSCYAKDSEVYFRNSFIYDSNSALKLSNSFGKIENSIIKNNKKSGIQLINSNFSISRNIIVYNESYGLYLDQNSKANIKNNYIDDNYGYNVRLEKDMKIYR